MTGPRFTMIVNFGLPINQPETMESRTRNTTTTVYSGLIVLATDGAFDAGRYLNPGHAR
jgi:hypothetical protein